MGPGSDASSVPAAPPSRFPFVPVALVVVVAAAWLMLLRPYGFQLEDEGTLLAWFDRAARGQRPYLDFHTGYTPGTKSYCRTDQ